jgi:hypothetical protein
VVAVYTKQLYIQQYGSYVAGGSHGILRTAEASYKRSGYGNSASGRKLEIHKHYFVMQKHDSILLLLCSYYILRFYYYSYTCQICNAHSFGTQFDICFLTFVLQYTVFEKVTSIVSI